MKKRLLLIIPAVFLLVMIGLIVYWNPPSTPVSYKFDAVKVDFSGNDRGIYTIEISGDHIKPYFGTPRLDLTIKPFDGLWSIDTTDYSSTFKGSPIEKDISGAFLTVNVNTFDQSANSFRGAELAFCQDFDRWCYRDDKGKVLYIGSVSGNFTVQELFDFFEPIIPGNWLPE